MNAILPSFFSKQPLLKSSQSSNKTSFFKVPSPSHASKPLQSRAINTLKNVPSQLLTNADKTKAIQLCALLREHKGSINHFILKGFQRNEIDITSFHLALHLTFTRKNIIQLACDERTDSALKTLNLMSNSTQLPDHVTNACIIDVLVYLFENDSIPERDCKIAQWIKIFQCNLSDDEQLGLFLTPNFSTNLESYFLNQNANSQRMNNCQELLVTVIKLDLFELLNGIFKKFVKDPDKIPAHFLYDILEQRLDRDQIDTLFDDIIDLPYFKTFGQKTISLEQSVIKDGSSSLISLLSRSSHLPQKPNETWKNTFIEHLSPENPRLISAFRWMFFLEVFTTIEPKSFYALKPNFFLKFFSKLTTSSQKFKALEQCSQIWQKIYSKDNLDVFMACAMSSFTDAERNQFLSKNRDDSYQIDLKIKTELYYEGFD
ncbi:MAG: hypothetical protein JHC93_04700 [Parachlamydiales bacterium]|nr:hypothetical protein [Parachlamydiales bacterium]